LKIGNRLVDDGNEGGQFRRLVYQIFSYPDPETAGPAFLGVLIQDDRLRFGGIVHGKNRAYLLLVSSLHGKILFCRQNINQCPGFCPLHVFKGLLILFIFIQGLHQMVIYGLLVSNETDLARLCIDG